MPLEAVHPGPRRQVEPLEGAIGRVFQIRRAVCGFSIRNDWQTERRYGGGYLLGLNGLVVIAHGSSTRVAIANAIRLAARGVEHDVVGRLRERLSAGVLASARSTTPTPEK